jgi:leucyl aminopeptidase
MSPSFAASDTDTIPLFAVPSEGFDLSALGLAPAQKAWVTAQGFTGALGSVATVPDADGNIALALAGMGTASARRRGRFHLATAAAKLPQGTYHIAGGIAPEDLEEATLGWLLSQYRFDRYRAQPAARAALQTPATVDAAKVIAMAEGEFLTRDLINTPASDMGPPDVEAAARELAQQHDATISVTEGDDLLAGNFPMIHTVGRAADRAPRLIDMTWGTSGPKLTLVGKGVCFDTGGLNIKPGGSMGLMKKDMGGSAAVLGLAHMIMGTGLELRLRVLIPAVENSISDNAFRPQDILTSRKGLTVEINNTDAEGRLVLADALALADEEPTDCIISMATLTGAARVAVGPDLAPYFTDDAATATAIESSAAANADPVWRLPFHDPYESMIEPGIADLDNAPKGGFAGTITAALFLRRFVENSPRYVHFDIYGWQPSAAPARPKGGVGQGTRAILNALPEILGL